MSDKNTKTSLEEAKLSFDEIQKYAKEQAAAQLEEQVAEKLKQIFEEKLNEDITITISGDGIDVANGEENGAIASVASPEETQFNNDMELGGSTNTISDEDEFTVSDEEDEIALDEVDFDYEKDGVKYGKNYLPEPPQEINLNTNENMEGIRMEDAAPAAAPAVDTTAAPVDAAATPAAPGTEVAQPGMEAPSMPDLLSKLDTLISVLMQKEGGAVAEDPAAAGTEQEFDVIDDEAGAAPGGAPAAPAPAVPGMQEEIEITDFESDKEFIDEMEEEVMEIVDEDNMPLGNAVEETRSLGFTSKRTGDKALKMGAMADEKGHHAPVTALQEGKIKAQYESKIDELIKENSGLKNSVKALKNERKEFEEAFVGLRTQFDEMQLFNGKLALVNKVLMNGGLTTEEKIKVCEQFDSVQSYEDANKLFKSIIKENNIKVGDVASKLKGAATNTAKAKSTVEPLYESDEARRAKKLAGISKIEDEE